MGPWGARGVGAALVLVAATAEPRQVRLRYAIDVPPASEREVCEHVVLPAVPPGLALAGSRIIVRSSSRLATSHHALVIDASDQTVLATGPQDGTGAACITGPPVLLLATIAALRLPAGIRLPWHERQPLVLNLHAVNGGARPARVRMTARFRLSRARPTDRLAYGWTVQLLTIRVPPFAVLPVTTRVQLPPMHVLTVASHMHARATQITASLNGAPWYEQTDWRHPRFRTFTPPLDVSGAELDVTCVYDNGITRPVRECAGLPCDLVYGPLAEDAMCGVGGYAIAP